MLLHTSSNQCLEYFISKGLIWNCAHSKAVHKKIEYSAT